MLALRLRDGDVRIVILVPRCLSRQKRGSLSPIQSDLQRCCLQSRLLFGRPRSGDRTGLQICLSKTGMFQSMRRDFCRLARRKSKLTTQRQNTASESPPFAGFSRNSLKSLKLLDFLAGAGGFEPPHGGIKIPCLTTWRRPNSVERFAARSGLAVSRRSLSEGGWPVSCRKS